MLSKKTFNLDRQHKIFVKIIIAYPVLCCAMLVTQLFRH